MKKIIAALTAATILLFSAVSCTGKGEKTNVIRLNEVTHSVFYAPLYIAIENGFFKEEGLEIELTNGGGADKVMTALLSGSADVGLMGVEATIYVFAEGKTDCPTVFGQLTKRDGSFLVSRTPDENFTWEKLEGKEVIAGRTGGVPAMTFEYVVNKHGLYNGQNITLNNDVAFNLMGPAFEGGTGDYTTLFEPTASEYQAAGKGYVVASVGEESGEIPYTAFTAMNSYIKNNSDNVRKFVRAMYRAIKYLGEQDENEVAQTIVGQFPGTPVKSIADSLASYKRIDAWMTDMTMKKTAFDNLQNVMENAGQLPRHIDLDDITDKSFATEEYEKLFG